MASRLSIGALKGVARTVLPVCVTSLRWRRRRPCSDMRHRISGLFELHQPHPRGHKRGATAETGGHPDTVSTLLLARDSGRLVIQIGGRAGGRVARTLPTEPVCVRSLRSE